MPMSRENRQSIEACQFTLQTILAYIACVGLLLVLLKSALAEFPNGGIEDAIILLIAISPWAIGTFFGIARSVRHKRSPLWGAVAGGCLGAAVFPILPFMYLFVRGLNAVDSSTVTPQIIAAILCSFAMGLIYSGCRWFFRFCGTYLDSVRGS